MKSKILAAAILMAFASASFAQTTPAPSSPPAPGSGAMKAAHEKLKADREKLKADHEMVKADKQKLREDRKAMRAERRAQHEKHEAAKGAATTPPTK